MDTYVTPNDMAYMLIGCVIGVALTIGAWAAALVLRSMRWIEKDRRSGKDRRAEQRSTTNPYATAKKRVEVPILKCGAPDSIEWRPEDEW